MTAPQVVAGGTPADTPGRGGRWKSSLALGFVLVALVALAAIPIAVNWRTAEFRQALREVAEPARSEITRIHVALAVGGSVLGDYLTTGDAQYLARYASTVAAEQGAYERLEPLAHRLGPDVVQRYVELRDLAARRYADVAGLLDGPSATAREVADQQSLFEGMLLAAARLDEAITRESQVRRDAISEAEQFQFRAILVLVPLALLAALAVALLGHGLHVFADQAERGRREVERLMESKARLIRGFSHDVKNPLGAADGYAELLEAGVFEPLTPRQARGIGQIRRSIGTALRTIDDLVELSRADAGRLDIAVEAIDSAQLVREAAEEHRAAVAAAGLDFHVLVPGRLPVIRTDPARVRQILSNLLSNAVKYTDRGGITLAAAVRAGDGSPGGGDWLAIDVHDTGVGVAPGHQERIFAEFTRVEPGASRGAGLGLAISRSIARLLGGDITVRSAMAEGSTFTLWLPVTDAGRAEPSRAARAAPSRDAHASTHDSVRAAIHHLVGSRQPHP